MGERLLLALLSCAAGILIGLFAPGFLPGAQEMRLAERDWLEAATPQPAPTAVPLVVARPSAPQISAPPTLVPPPPPPTPTLARLREHGAQLVSDEVVQYEDTYRLCYICGPEGLLIGLAEELG